jgi:hypothetical protein
MGTEMVFTGRNMNQDVKLSTGRHLVPEVNNEWSNTFTPTYAFIE